MRTRWLPIQFTNFYSLCSSYNSPFVLNTITLLFYFIDSFFTLEKSIRLDDAVTILMYTEEQIVGRSGGKGENHKKSRQLVKNGRNRKISSEMAKLHQIHQIKAPHSEI